MNRNETKNLRQPKNKAKAAPTRHQQRHRPIPRDLYIDRETGKGYIKIPGTIGADSTIAPNNSFLPLNDGLGEDDEFIVAFEPYGRNGNDTQGEKESDYAHRKLKKGKSAKKDSIKPIISNVHPANQAVLSSNTFQIRATVTDNIKVGTVSVTLVNTATGFKRMFSLSNSGNSVWIKTIQALPGATLKMTITATDSSQNSVTTTAMTFKTGKSTSSSGGGGTSGTAPMPTPTNRNPVSEAQWADRTAPISRASGRLLFQMADSKGNVLTYVCSGTLVQLPSSSSSTTTATTPDRSVVLTAAHCVYDDDNKQFARNVVFIPQQDDGGMDVSDRDCTNDVLGCLTMDYGFVSNQYASRIFPNNIGADYGFYVSKSTKTSVKGKRIGGKKDGSDIVPMMINFGPITAGGWTYAMGYSYADDPNFMYSVGPVGKDNDGLVPNHSLKSCALTRGSSGGPWTQDTSTTLSDGVVRIMGANSWGYVGEPGMASSPLNTGGAACVYNAAVSADLASIAGYGRVVNCNI